MREEQNVVVGFLENAPGGLFLWILLGLGVWLARLPLGLVELLFLLAPWVFLPLGLGILRGTSAAFVPSPLAGIPVLRLRAASAGAATLSLFFKTGALASALTAPWLGFCGLMALDGAMRLWRSHGRPLWQGCFGAGELYLAVGAVWLALSRWGAEPLGFQEPIVFLTAVHFHSAGFASSILAGRILQAAAGARQERLFQAAASAAVIGPGLLGAAFLLGPRFKLLAVGVLVLGHFGIAFATLRVVRSLSSGPGSALLFISAASEVVAMTLALSWALGEFPLHPFVGLQQMARYHGVLNAFGFLVCGLWGWTLLGAEKSAVQGARSWELR